MDATVTAQGEQLRAAAKSLRDDVLDEVELARQKLRESCSVDDFGPTVSPAAQQFFDAWRKELEAAADAVTQLSESLDEAAYNYDATDGGQSRRIDRISP